MNLGEKLNCFGVGERLGTAAAHGRFLRDQSKQPQLRLTAENQVTTTQSRFVVPFAGGAVMWVGVKRQGDPGVDVQEPLHAASRRVAIPRS